jgi:hypothetical protein
MAGGILNNEELGGLHVSHGNDSGWEQCDD